MKSPGRALAWEFWRRHRWGWIAIAGYLVVMASVKAWALSSGHAVGTGDEETFGLFVMGPFSATILFAITVFSFGYSGDLSGRESMFPSRLLRLPITTRAL